MLKISILLSVILLTACKGESLEKPISIPTQHEVVVLYYPSSVKRKGDEVSARLYTNIIGQKRQYIKESTFNCKYNVEVTHTLNGVAVNETSYLGDSYNTVNYSELVALCNAR